MVAGEPGVRLVMVGGTLRLRPRLDGRQLGRAAVWVQEQRRGTRGVEENTARTLAAGSSVVSTSRRVPRPAAFQGEVAEGVPRVGRRERGHNGQCERQPGGR